MSVYAYGSASHCALGYVVSHQSRDVEKPRRVNGIEGEATWLGCSKTFTMCLTDHGSIYRWGKDFGIIPKKLLTNIYFSNVYSCPFSVNALATAKLSNQVYIIHRSGTVSALLWNSKPVHAISISSCRNSWLIVEENSLSLIQIPQNGGRLSSALLSPSDILLLSPAKSLWSNSAEVYACESAISGEVRIWRNSSCKSQSKILISDQDISGEWESASSEFFLKNIDDLALPLIGDVGYAICRDYGCIVRFTLSKSGLHYGETLRFEKEALWRSIAWDREGLLAINSAGDTFLIPHNIEPGVIHLSSMEPVLRQVESIVSSGHHVAAIIRILPHVDPPPRHAGISLQRLCTRSVMKSSVTVENVCNLLESILERAVIDLPDLLDCLFSFLRLNKPFISIVARDSLERLEARKDFSALITAIGENIPSNNLMSLRQAESFPSVQPIREVKPKSLALQQPKRTRQSSRTQILPGPACTFVSGTVDTRTSTPEVFFPTSPKETDTALNLDEFAPLADLSNTCRGRSPRLTHKKVSKWTSFKVDNSPTQAPWLHAGTPPTPYPTIEIPPDKRSRQKLNSTTRPSRWFITTEQAAVPLPELMKLEQEYQEEAEAIRLVEEYENSLAVRKAKTQSRFQRPRTSTNRTNNYKGTLK